MGNRRKRKPRSQFSSREKKCVREDLYKYLRVQRNNKPDLSHNTHALLRKKPSRLFLLWRLRSFSVCNRLMKVFHQSAVASALFALCCGAITAGEEGQLCGRSHHFLFTYF